MKKTISDNDYYPLRSTDREPNIYFYRLLISDQVPKNIVSPVLRTLILSDHVPEPNISPLLYISFGASVSAQLTGRRRYHTTSCTDPSGSSLD